MTQALVALACLGLVAVGAWLTRSWLPFRAAGKTSPEYNDAPFMIEPQTGALHVKGSNLVLRRAMPKAEFLDSDLYRHTKKSRLFELDGGSGQAFLVAFHDPIFENVYLQLNFENDQLGNIDFGWSRQITAPEWTRELVDAEISRYRTFLIQQLGSITNFPKEFRWGKVYAARDDKAGAPALGIRYRGFEFRAQTT